MMPRRGMMPPEQAGKPVPLPAVTPIDFIHWPKLTRPGLATVNPRSGSSFGGRGPKLGRQ